MSVQYARQTQRDLKDFYRFESANSEIFLFLIFTPKANFNTNTNNNFNNNNKNS